jgi:hypothetical protein
MEKTMKLLKYLMPFAMATCGFVATVGAADFATSQEARDRDDAAVYDFVKSKRAVSVAEKGGALMMSGVVRSEWDFMHCRNDGKSERGSSSSKRTPPERPHAPYASNEFSVELDLMFDYKTDRTWAAAQLQFDNSAGTKSFERKKGISSNRNILWGSGTGDDLFMRKAYVGYNVAEHGTSRFDVEIGRRRLYDVFDSRVQFYSIFDGLLLKYANSFEGATDFTAKASAFVIDDTVNHFGYVGELGFLNIADSGADFKYSIIDWDTVATNRYGLKNPRGADFLVSQYTVGYTLSPDLVHYKTKLYGAFLHNSRAHATHFTNHQKKANAWYAGVMVGEVRKKGDWSADVNYQWVQANAMPEEDASGIQRDNPRKISMYNSHKGGYANYQGYKLNFFYALTDNLTLNTFFERAREESHKIGGKHRSFNFQVAAIYAF